MNIYIPYTYLIGWSQQNKYYYGVQYSKTSNPANLWTKYFTSSKIVKQFREQYGEPDIIQVRQCFCSSLSARTHEYKVLSRLNVLDNDNWLNQTPGAGIYFKCAGHTDATRAKMSNSAKGKLKSAEHRAKIREYAKRRSVDHENKLLLAKIGKLKSDATRAKMSESQKGKKCSAETKMKMAEAHRGKMHTTESKQKMSVSNRKTYKIIYTNRTEENVVGLDMWVKEKFKIHPDTFRNHRRDNNLAKYGIISVIYTN